jgi:acetate kinase
VGRTYDRILTVNAGSTSEKVSLVLAGDEVVAYPSLDAAVAQAQPDVVAHRVVHGGTRTSATVIDDATRADLGSLVELAPLHQPPALRLIDRCRDTWPHVPQVACFDTAFHATIPTAARTYALPERLRRLVRVYGFHGLSHRWAAGQVATVAPDARRVLVAHLGGGASLCAVLDGASVWTSMGFTPLDGLVMATRSGSLDPGAVLWLAANTREDLSVVLEKESGLLGLAGTADMRDLLSRVERGDTVAAEAFDVYVQRLVVAAGSAVATMGGLDVLAFTGGVGENAPAVRRALAHRLDWLGVRTSGTGVTPTPDQRLVDITEPGAPVRTVVVPAREDLEMAAEVRAVAERL